MWKGFNFFAMVIILCLFCFWPQPARAATLDPAAVIKRVEDNLNGKTAELSFTMVVKTRRGARTIKMTSYSIGKKKSFIKIHYPGKDKGITFLKIDNAMWQYVPRIERVLKIPASMMLQSWMGSDFTNDDLVRESSILEDYNHRIISQGKDDFEVELLPHENAPVVWGRIVMGVSKTYFLPTTVKYYDDAGKLVRTISYQQVKKFGARFYPTYWVLTPKDKEKAGHRTTVEITAAVFDKPVSEEYFTKMALRRFSD